MEISSSELQGIAQVPLPIRFDREGLDTQTSERRTEFSLLLSLELKSIIRDLPNDVWLAISKVQREFRKHNKARLAVFDIELDDEPIRHDMADEPSEGNIEIDYISEMRFLNYYRIILAWLKTKETRVENPLKTVA